MKLKITILLSLLFFGFGFRSHAQSPITGPTSVCIGNTIVLSDVDPAGTWASSATTIATVDINTGSVGGVASGNTVITYTSILGVSTYTVGVGVPTVITGSRTTICNGSTFVLSDAISGGTWVSSNVSIATVDTGGFTVYAISGTSGNSTITYDNGCGTAAYPITVIASPSAITGSTHNICDANTLVLSDGISGGTWTSSNTAIATIATGGFTVNPISGANGSTTITYDNGCGTSTFVINVTPLLGPISGATSVCSGFSIILSDAVTGGTWSSSSTAASVSGGVVTANTVITSTPITISYSDVCNTQTYTLTVNPYPTVITSAASTVCAGSTVLLSDGVTGGTWTSSNTAIATILPAGFTVTGVSAGSVVIDYITGCATVNYNLTVLPITAVITGTVTTLCTGSTATLSDATPGGTWSSSSTAIANVVNGVVTGVAIGAVTITYSNGCTPQTYSLTVTQTPTAIVGLNGFCQGSTSLLTSTPAGGVWSSDNTTVATVNSTSGVILGSAIGAADIIYTLSDGCSVLIPVSVSNCPACPINSDFELGNYSVWSYYTGTCCPINTPTSVTPPASTPNRFMLMNTFTAPTVDPFGGFPTVGAGLYSLRIGTCQSSRYASKAVYFVHVPTGTSTNYSLIYRYAVVMEDPGHSAADQPRFTVQALDSATNTAIPCAFFNYVAGSLPGFIGPVNTSTPTCTPDGGSSVYYKPWATTSINLAGLGGHTIRMEFAAGDCNLGGHWGYGYVDMTCGTFAISSVGCGDSIATVSAPAGFANYAWYDSLTFTTLYGTTQTVSFPMPSVPTTYAVIMTPFTGFGCPDTLYTTIQPSNLQLHKNNDTSVCKGQAVILGINATDIALPLTYSWTPAINLSCTTCANPHALGYAGTTAFIVTVTDAAGCTKTDSIKVRTDSVAAYISTTATSCAGVNDGTATSTVSSGIAPFSYSWSTAPAQTTAEATNLGVGTYSVTITDSLGCKGTAFNSVVAPPPLTMNIDSLIGPSRCLDTNGRIVLGGLKFSSDYVVRYIYNGVVYVTPTITSSATGEVTITGFLPAGVYDSISIVTTGCPYNTLGPVTLLDPAPPLIPFVSSNSPICEGTTLSLNTSDATTGVTYLGGPAGFADITQTPTRPNAALGDAGTYIVTVTKDSCSSHNSIVVVINPNPTDVASSVKSTICSGDTIRLINTAIPGADNYLWNGPNGFTSNLQNPVIINAPVAAAGVYTVTVTYNTCIGSATTAIVVNQSPDAPVVVDTNYCQNDSPVPPITAIGDNLTWYLHATDGLDDSLLTAPTPVTTTPGIFTWYVTQRNAECRSPKAPLTVGVYTLPNPTFTVMDSVFCRGANYTFNVNNANTGTDFQGVTWLFNGMDSIQNVNPILHAFDGTGVIIVTAEVYYNVCPDSKLTQNIMVYPYPVIHLGADTSICPGGDPITVGDFENAPSSTTSWMWNTGETTPLISIVAPGTYYNTVNVNGCSTSDTIIVQNDCYLSMPNVFTPNGDGVNDFFFPRQYLAKGLTSFSMNIYNRWGQLVFATTSIDGKGWDGSFNNTPQPEGVFVYIIDATFKDGQKEHHQGNITLLR